MGARFHLLDNEVFSARIPGKLPSEADRKKFKSPKLRKGMLERAIYPQLVRSPPVSANHRCPRAIWTDRAICLMTRALSSSPC